MGDNIDVIMPIMFPALYENTKTHWNRYSGWWFHSLATKQAIRSCDVVNLTNYYYFLFSSSCRAIHSSVYNALKIFADISPRLYDSCTLEYNERIQKWVIHSDRAPHRPQHNFYWLTNFLTRSQKQREDRTLFWKMLESDAREQRGKRLSTEMPKAVPAGHHGGFARGKVWGECPILAHPLGDRAGWCFGFFHTDSASANGNSNDADSMQYREEGSDGLDQDMVSWIGFDWFMRWVPFVFIGNVSVHLMQLPTLTCVESPGYPWMHR
jgi:hypothetical protein